MSFAALQYAVDEEGWQRPELSVAVADYKHVQKVSDLTDGLLEDVQQRMTALQTLKRDALAPKYIAVEAAILGKAKELIQTLSAENPVAAQQLKSIAELVVNLQTMGGKTGVAGNGGGDDKGATKIVIQNKVSHSDAEEQETTIAISAPSA